MSERIEEQKQELIKFLRNDYEAWRAREIEGGRINASMDRYSAERLGINQSSFSRIMHGLIVPTDYNLLQMVFNLGTTKPLKIMGKEKLLANDPRAIEMAVKLRWVRPEVRDAVAYLLDNDVALEDLDLSKIKIAPA